MMIFNASFHAARVATGLLALAWAMAMPAQAAAPQFQLVADGIFAAIGETGARSYDNEGLNANFGLVVTPQGAILIDSGASARGAQQLAAAAGAVTAQPIRWVINTGGQDHRWLGNAWFIAQGAAVIAHPGGRADLQNRGNDHLQALRPVLKERLDGTVPALPTQWLPDSPDSSLELGGLRIEFRHRGGAHTPGDVIVWLPQARVAFSGDVVYTDRMLGVIPVSHTGRWLASFAALETLDPKLIVPGHGRVSDLATARADTLIYLQALRAHIKKAVDDGTDVSAAANGFDGRPFLRLLNAAELMPGNASRTYLELERE